jgi:hypothetical protein
MYGYHSPAEDKILNVKPEFANDRSLEYPMAEAYTFKRSFFSLRFFAV